MDRDLLYPGQIGLIDNFLNVNKAAMIASAAVAEAVLGQTTQVFGLGAAALSNTTVAGSAFAISIGRGGILSYQETDPNAYGVLGTDTTTNILKTGLNLSPTNIGLTNAAPATAGYSVNYLVSAAFQEIDTNLINLPFYNSGGAPTITAENGTRTQRVVFQVVGGAPAATGTQGTPAVPAGYVPLYVVTVTNGETAVAGGNIRVAAGTPFIATTVFLATEINTINSEIAPLLSRGPAPLYTAAQTGTISIAANTTYNVNSVSFTMPSYSSTGAFRVRGRMVAQGHYVGSSLEDQNFQSVLSYDGTAAFTGSAWLITASSSGNGWSVSDYFESTATYAEGAGVTFSMSVATSGGGTDYTIGGCFLEIFVTEA